MVAAGRVSVNGKRITEIGTSADPDVDDIRLDGAPIPTTPEQIYVVLNKPIGYVATVKDRHAAHTVMELVKGVSGRIYPVGRLDVDTAGLLILTNDGAFTERLTHPSHQVPKTYRAVVRGEVAEWAAIDLRKGIMLDDGMTAPAQVEWVDFDKKNNATILDITIHEGRNRQVRRMFDAVGYPVLALTRMRIGPITLKGLVPGGWRKLHSSEVKLLLAEADSRPDARPQRPPEDVEEIDNTSLRPKSSKAPTEIRAAAEALTRSLREGSTLHRSGATMSHVMGRKSAGRKQLKASSQRAK